MVLLYSGDWSVASEPCDLYNIRQTKPRRATNLSHPLLVLNKILNMHLAVVSGWCIPFISQQIAAGRPSTCHQLLQCLCGARAEPGLRGDCCCGNTAGRGWRWSLLPKVILFISRYFSCWRRTITAVRHNDLHSYHLHYSSFKQSFSLKCFFFSFF